MRPDNSKAQAPPLQAGPLRVLLTGASGLLGGRIAERLRESFDVITTRHRAAAHGDGESVGLDLGSSDSVEAAFDRARPDAVVHAAALSDVDRCEREPELARSVNVSGSERIAQACATRGLALVALSTDLVFPGDLSLSAEGAMPQPLSVYGRTKLAGEVAILALCPSAAVTRVALVIGRGHGPRGTGTEAIAWALRGGRAARLFSDQYRTPIDADSVAEAIALALQRRASGRYHLGGPERVSRYELGLRVARVLGLPSALVEAVAYRDEPTEAPRPADASLDSRRAREEFGWAPRGLDAAILLSRMAPDIIAPR